MIGDCDVFTGRPGVMICVIDVFTGVQGLWYGTGVSGLTAYGSDIGNSQGLWRDLGSQDKDWVEGSWGECSKGYFYLEKKLDGKEV